MIVKNKIYIININNLDQVKSFSINKNTPKEMATYLIGRRIDLHLLCKIDGVSIILKNDTYWDMIKEIQCWLECREPRREKD